MIWLIGAGQISYEYSRILDKLKINYLIIGRGKKSAKKFKSKKNVSTGGISNFLKKKPICTDKAIVCVNVENLKSATIQLINYGVKNILLEKPGGINFKEVRDLSNFARVKRTNVKIAYNRRFYSSVIKAKELIKKDGGVQNFNFDFTEWTHLIKKLKKNKKILKNWFFLNSTHVVDLAFYIGGVPIELNSFTKKNSLWNKCAVIYSGAGKTKSGSIFTYHANWQSAGRWSIEFLTSKGKYILCPLEKLFFQKRGSLELKEIKLNYKIDRNFKPGFYTQVKAFLENTDKNIPTLLEHCSMISIYRQIIKR
jgi:predicted dehydrogenase